MRRSALVFVLGVAAVLWLVAQRDHRQDHPPYEVKLVFPRETSPGLYRQIEERELETLAEQGWELVSVMPYIYRNEEHAIGNDSIRPKPVVTQTYPAYFFKRQKIITK
jgi:hypothetical protein